jgi:hypothetical protein
VAATFARRDLYARMLYLYAELIFDELPHTPLPSGKDKKAAEVTIGGPL